MFISNSPITATFYYETSRVAGPPEEILTRMCLEQTTSGYDTLTCRPSAPRLVPYQASIHSLQPLPSNSEVNCGFAEIDFPWTSVSQTGNSLEDALCFVIGESSHVAGMLKLRLMDLGFPTEMTG